MEKKILEDYYSQLTSILQIDRISPQLISARVINIDDLEEINNLKTSKEKASFVLQQIARSLNGHITTSFYSLLRIMEKYGGDIASLANNIRRALIKSSGDLFINNLNL